MATVTFLGAAQEVTGSCHMLESEATGRIILDCGLHQGGDIVKRLSSEKFHFKCNTLDAVILSHAHLDHCGLLPKLVNQGFCGPIYCTEATADLLRIMLNDAVDLYERDLERENLRQQRRGKKRHIKAEYTQQDVDKVFSLCVGIPYLQETKFGPNASVIFHDAGHILGSATTEIKLKEDGREKRIVYSGDLGNKDATLMNKPSQLHKADLVLMESTYGNRNHRDLQQTFDQLTDIIARTWDRRGNVLIPAFAVGRTQEILFHLGRLHANGLLDNWRIFLDSPMAYEVTRLYDKWLHLLNHKDVEEITQADDESLEGFLPPLQISESPVDSMAINEIDHGAIVIAGSGMCTGGRIRHHLKHRIWREENTVIFVGFQAQGSLGRRLVDGAEKFRMFNEEFAVKASIETLGGFSAHAGQRELVEWVSNFDDNPQIALVHGEPIAMQALANKLKQERNIDCNIPFLKDQLTF